MHDTNLSFLLLVMISLAGCMTQDEMPVLPAIHIYNEESGDVGTVISNAMINTEQDAENIIDQLQSIPENDSETRISEHLQETPAKVIMTADPDDAPSPMHLSSRGRERDDADPSDTSDEGDAQEVPDVPDDGGTVEDPMPCEIDTAGVQVIPDGFSHEGLTQITWAADIYEYEGNAYPGTDIVPLRMEFNCIILLGDDGQSSLCMPIQNLIHQYEDSSCRYEIRDEGGIGLYFTFHDTRISSGFALDADPDAFPRFRRFFENIDQLGLSGTNVYSNDQVIDPGSQPATIRWSLVRGIALDDPQGNLFKDLDCRYQSLNGAYREWKVTVTIEGRQYPVGTYYIPEGYAEYVHPTTPLILHQEYFGQCDRRLDLNKGRVEYYDFEVRDSINSYSVPDWKILYRIPNSDEDTRYGIGVIAREGQRLFTSVGHETDVALDREIGTIFTDIE